MADRHSAAIAIVGRKGGADAFDVSVLSQSLPCKPRSLARITPESEPPPLELPSTSSPAHEPVIDTEKGRTLIRFSAEITEGEFSSTPAEREMYLSQSCPTWGTTFAMPGQDVDFARREPEESAPGAMAVPGHLVDDGAVEAEGVIGKSPTILETFKMYNGSGSLMDPEMSKLDDITEEPIPAEDNNAERDDDDDEDQFSLDA